MNRLSARGTAVLALALAIWVALAVSLALSNTPWTSEAWFAIPALNLLTRGNMGTTVLASKGTWLVGIDRHTYWIMPLDPLIEASWYKLVGFSLFRERLLSILFGVGALVSWFTIVRRLSGTYSAALIAVLIVGFERHFLDAAANGRMDMMAAALGAAGLAAFLQFRGRSLRTSLLISHALVAAAVFTHPCGVLFLAALVLTTAIAGARDRIAPRAGDIAAAALPWLVAVALWGAYIAEAPSDFKSQFFGNMSGFAGEYLKRGRFGGIRAPFNALWMELKLRYLLPFGFGALRTFGGVASTLWLCLYASAALMAACNRDLRRQPAVRILSACGIAVFLIMALFEGMKFEHYLVYSLPFAGALAAVVGDSLWRGAQRCRAYTRAGLCVVLVALIVPVAVFNARHFMRNPLRKQFLPVAGWIKRQRAPGDRAIGPAELGYVLGFTDSISDDVRMGYYTGLRPRFIVTSDWYRDWIRSSARFEPDVYRHIQAVLDDEYSSVLAGGEYIVYERKAR